MSFSFRLFAALLLQTLPYCFSHQDSRGATQLFRRDAVRVRRGRQVHLGHGSQAIHPAPETNQAQSHVWTLMEMLILIAAFVFVCKYIFTLLQRFTVKRDAAGKGKAAESNFSAPSWLESRTLLKTLRGCGILDFVTGAGGCDAVALASKTNASIKQCEPFQEKPRFAECGGQSSPFETKDSLEELRHGLGVGVVCKKALKEAPNQDSFSILYVPGQLQLYGVYDGHGPLGHDVSQFVRDILPKIFLRDERRSSNPERALSDAFLETQKLLEHATAAQDLDARDSGTTVTIVYIPHGSNQLYVAHVGDSRAMLVNLTQDGYLSGHMDITVDHKPNIPIERARIERAGGEVRFDGFLNHRVFAKGRAYPGLNMSRSLGDLNAHRCGLSAAPDVQAVTINADAALFMSSDGVWEFIESQECAKVVRDQLAIVESQSDHAAASQALLEELAKRSWERWMADTGGQESDDICAICVRRIFAGNTKCQLDVSSEGVLAAKVSQYAKQRHGINAARRTRSSRTRKIRTRSCSRRSRSASGSRARGHQQGQTWNAL